MNRIEVRGLRCLGRHGVLEHEQRDPQPFEIDLDVVADLEAPAASDDLSDAVDYGGIVESVRRRVETGRFALLEALARAIASDVLGDPRVEEVTVTVRKLRPPLPAELDTVGVRFHLHRPST